MTIVKSPNSGQVAYHVTPGHVFAATGIYFDREAIPIAIAFHALRIAFQVLAGTSFKEIEPVRIEGIHLPSVELYQVDVKEGEVAGTLLLPMNAINEAIIRVQN